MGMQLALCLLSGLFFRQLFLGAAFPVTLQMVLDRPTHDDEYSVFSSAR
jgi:hypothetical protein